MKKQTYTEAKNWNVRYTIRYENGTAILYRDEKKIVKKEDLFTLLQTTHSKLGHGGSDVMWKEINFQGGDSARLRRARKI